MTGGRVLGLELWSFGSWPFGMLFLCPLVLDPPTESLVSDDMHNNRTMPCVPIRPLPSDVVSQLQLVP